MTNKLNNLQIQNLITALTLQQVKVDQLVYDRWYYSTLFINKWNSSWPNCVIADENEIIPIRLVYLESGKTITEKQITELIRTAGYYADLIQIGCADLSTYELNRHYNDKYSKIWFLNYDWIHKKVGYEFQWLVDTLIQSRADLNNRDLKVKLNDRFNKNPHEFKNPPSIMKLNLIDYLKKTEIKLI